MEETRKSRGLRSDANFRSKKWMSSDRKVAEDLGKASLGKDGCLAGDLTELGSRISCGVQVVYKVTSLSKAVGRATIVLWRPSRASGWLSGQRTS